MISQIVSVQKTKMVVLFSVKTLIGHGKQIIFIGHGHPHVRERKVKEDVEQYMNHSLLVGGEQLMKNGNHYYP